MRTELLFQPKLLCLPLLFLLVVCLSLYLSLLPDRCLFLTFMLWSLRLFSADAIWFVMVMKYERSGSGGGVLGGWLVLPASVLLLRLQAEGRRGKRKEEE